MVRCCKINLVGIVFLLSYFVLSAQSIVTIKDLRLRHFQLKDGLPSQMVERIIEDHLGYIWIGTYNGLLRYDGYNFEKIVDGKIGAILEDSDGYIWIGTEQDLLRYDPKTGRQRSFYYKDKVQQPENWYDVIALAQDRTGAIVVGTGYDGLIRLLPIGLDSFDFYRYPYSYDPRFRRPSVLSDTLPGNWIWNIVTADNGSTWLGTAASLVEMVIPDQNNPAKVQFKYTIPPFEPYEASDYFGVSHINKGRDGKLWIVAKHRKGNTSYHNGLIFQFDPETRNFVEYRSTQDPSISYRYIQEDNEGNLWNGPADIGLQFIAASAIDTVDATHRLISRFKSYPFVKPGDISIGSNNTQGFLEDRSGAIWVLSNFIGVFQIPRKLNAFRYYETPVYTRNDNNGVSDILSDGTNNIWVATWRNGLYKYELETGKNIQYVTGSDHPMSPNVFELFKDSKEGLWALTDHQAIHKFNKTTGNFETHKVLHHSDAKSAALNNEVFFSGISEDEEGNFWFGSNGLGLICYDPNQKIVINQFLPDTDKNHWIESNEIMGTLCDAKGNVWAGSLYHGLYFIEHDQQEDSYRFSRFLTEIPMIHKLMFDSAGHIWIGTLSHGLILFDVNKKEIIRQFSMENGLPSSNIWDIVEDPEGYLWLITAKALVKFNPKTFESIVFGASYGFDFSQKVINRGEIGDNDRLIFGGEGGFYTFDLNAQEGGPIVKPRIVLNQLSIDDKSPSGKEMGGILDTNIHYISALTLNHNQNNLAISYTGLYYDDPASLQYSYFLENYHSDWQHVGSQRVARLSNLSPGDYRFRVKVSNDSGSSDEKIFSLSIRSPWWWSGYTKVLYLLTAISLIWAYFHFRHHLHKEKIAKETSMNLNSMRSRFFANVSHEFRTPLTLIRGPIEDKLIVEKDPEEKKELNKIHDQTSRMLKLVNELLDLSKLDINVLKIQNKSGDIHQYLRANAEAFRSAGHQKGLHYSVNIPDEDALVLFDPENLEKIIVNLLSNAFKHCSDQGQVNFNARYDRAQASLDFEINNDGDPIPPDELENVFNRFYQASNAVQQGSGVGLALVSELTTLMNGSITISSSNKGGTTFEVKIPMVPSSTPAEIAFSTSLDVSDNDRSQTSSILLEKIGSGPSILVVEDSEEVLNYITSILSKHYQVTGAKNGKVGYESALEQLPDLIISDVMMPEMDGIVLCGKLKSDHRTDHIPIVLLTSKADIESRLEGLDSGADDYLQKPFNSRELVIRVANLIKQRETLKKRFKQHIQLDYADTTISSSEQRFLQKALEVVKIHLDDFDFDVQVFGTEMNLSRTHLHKKMKAITGQAPSEFIRNLKLQRASELLLACSDNVSQIAYAVGFANLSYFTKCFKEKYGVTPTDFTLK